MALFPDISSSVLAYGLKRTPTEDSYLNAAKYLCHDKALKSQIDEPQKLQISSAKSFHSSF